MNTKKALIVAGGWEGHEPEKLARRFRGMLKSEGFAVQISDTLAVLEDAEALKALHLIVPIWTMGELPESAAGAVSEAVAGGTGLAGCHGGMCDAFRSCVLWQFITGGNWVSHPGGEIEYRVQIKNSSSPLTAGIQDFSLTSEQYYLHVDPAVEVLATTRFPTDNPLAAGAASTASPHTANGAVDMPVAWTKRWGRGRVYYNSLGHHDDVFEIAEAAEMMKRGLLWAAEVKGAEGKENAP